MEESVQILDGTFTDSQQDSVAVGGVSFPVHVLFGHEPGSANCGHTRVAGSGVEPGEGGCVFVADVFGWHPRVSDLGVAVRGKADDRVCWVWWR
eukprot:4470598-Amphidinium_carterae.1